MRAAGTVPPLYHSVAWSAARKGTHDRFISTGVPGRDDRGVVVEAEPSRALPGHQLWRLRRISSHFPIPAIGAAIALAAKAARADSRVLRLSVEIAEHDPGWKAAVRKVLHHHGFTALAEPRWYSTTLMVDLKRSEDAILQSFSSKARRDIRTAARQGLETRPITDPRYAGRLHSLEAEAWSRTRATTPHADWASRIALSAEAPDLSLVVGAFVPGLACPDDLLAFGWGVWDGGIAHYDSAAATRQTAFKAPLSYPIIWHLIRWARAVGATHFDLGGAPRPEGRPEGDPLSGITAFKRWFSDDWVELGEEWVLEPHPIRAGIANSVHRVGRALGLAGGRS